MTSEILSWPISKRKTSKLSLKDETKVFRRFITPVFKLFGTIKIIESGVKLYAIKLSSVVGQFILDSSGVKALQVCPIPFSTANIKFGLPL